MVVGVGRRVEPFEQRSVPTDTLKCGDRIVEANRLVGVVIERVVEPFGGCRTNIHVRVATGGTKTDGKPTENMWCYSAATSCNIVD